MNLELKNYFVAFIDLLGFSNMVNHDCERPNGEQKYFEILYNAYIETKEIKKTIEGLQVTQFSDSVVLALPYCKNDFQKFIKTVAEYQYKLLGSGILCRGGISYGKHFSIDEFLFSSGMIDAYKIESKVATTPRIVISKELIELLYPKYEDLPDDGLLIRENDSLYFVNYLNKASPEETWSAITKIVPGNFHVDFSIRNKQVWLIDYYNYIFPENIVRKVNRFGFETAS